MFVMASSWGIWMPTMSNEATGKHDSMEKSGRPWARMRSAMSTQGV